MLTKIVVLWTFLRKFRIFAKIYVFQILSCPVCSVQVTYQTNFSSPTCLGWPDLFVLSWLSFCSGCPAPAVLFQLPCPGHLDRCFPDATVMSWQSCHLFPFLLTCPGWTVRLTPRLSCQDCPVPIVQMPCPDCPAKVILFPLPFPIFLSLLSRYGHPVLCFLSWLHYPDSLDWLSCPVPRRPCLACSVPAVLLTRSCPQLTCPHSPVLAVVSWHPSYPSCPCQPIQADLSGWPVQPNLSGLSYSVS